jgi:alpha-beta hydrolase superfamily lysophospholipase
MDERVPDMAIPRLALERVADWISDNSPVRSVPVFPPPQASSAVVGDGVDGEIFETPMFVGDAGLFGVMTETRGRSTGPTALFLSVANGHRIGPCRLWVDLARQWAQAGVRSFRFDLSGLGDSPRRHPAQPEFVWYAPEAFDDLIDVARAVSPEDPSNVILIGLCASGYQAIESAFSLLPKGLIAVNPAISFPPPEFANGGRLDPRRRAALPYKSVEQALHSDSSLSRLPRRFPNLSWGLRVWAEPRRRSGVWLRQLDATGADVLLVCGEREARPIRLGASNRTFDRLSRGGRFRFEHIPDLEHGLLIAEQRAHVTQLVTDHVIERFVDTEASRCEAAAVASHI